MLRRFALFASAGQLLLSCSREEIPKLHEDVDLGVTRGEPRSDVPSKWYSGGTLSGESAAAWKAATKENKLASCADMLASLWIGKKLKPAFAANVHTIEDLRSPAEQLVIALDKALSGDAGGSVDVATGAAMVIAMMGWV